MTVLHAAADVLRCFADDRLELTLTEIVALRGTPKSTTSRLLNAMYAAGFLDLSKAGRRYRPSSLLVHLGQVLKERSSLLARADQVIRDLVEETGHTGYVSALDQKTVVALVGHEGRHVLRVANAIGRRLQATASATGRALLSQMSDAEIESLLADGIDQPTPAAPAHVHEVLARVQEVRRLGYAQADGETTHGVGAIATVVRDPFKDVTLSLCIAFPVATISSSERMALIERLQAETDRLSHEFGADEHRHGLSKTPVQARAHSKRRGDRNG